MLEHINPGPRLSAAVVHNGMVYVSGQVPLTPNADVPTQTREILAKIDAILEQGGSDRRHIVSANIWLADIMTFDQMNKAWDEWIAPGPAPARATVEARIANPQWRVEIACIAAQKRS
jgi:enamine deaminase RidA (YjgF/YER057c/UK114 family)